MEKMKKALKILIIFMIVLCTITPIKYAVTSQETQTNTTQEQEEKIVVAYNSHVQDLGWEKDFSKVNGQESGTTGKNLKNEAIKIKLIEAPANVGIEYQVYVKDIGWQEWKKDGQEAGTTGQNRIMEAIKIKLTGTENYSVEYRTHLENYGWMDWKKDEEISGAVGKGLKMEAIQIRIVSKTTSVLYQSHVQDIGWQRYFANGETSGIAGKRLKIEAIKVEVKDGTKNIGVKYQSHVQDIGWEKTWKSSGEQSGTTGKNLKVEAIKIKIDEQYEDEYSIMYRVYVQNEGWQEWKKDGEVAGTTGQNKRIEAIEIKVVKKAPSNEFSIKYSAHVQDIGWQDYRKQGETAGVVGKKLKIEAIKIIGKNVPDGVTISYRTHVQDIGWEKDWKNAGEQSGTTGRNLKVEAVQIKLEGTEEYSITYRTYVQDKGWQDWANDGEISGTTGQNRRIEAIEIKIVPKIQNKIKMYVDTEVPPKIGQEEHKIKGWLMTDRTDVNIQLLVNDKKEDIKLVRTERADVLEAIKGYGGQDKNPKPGFEMTADFSKYDLGNVNLKIQFVDKDGKVLLQKEFNTEICKKIERVEGAYGKSGLKVAGKGGSDLPYLKYGNGENVFFATFAIHGYEDIWEKDGQELVSIANQFYNKLINDKDYELSEKWTIYIFPGVNQDGLKSGWTNNGPGRTTLYSQAPNNKGIDINRCWQVGDTYTRYTSDRNYNGTTGFQAYEAQALRDFLIANKSQKGQTLLVDLHGWTQQLIGDTQMCSYYEKQFPENDKSGVGRYGTGYLVNWARTYLGSSSGAAKSALIELPKEGVTGHQSVVDKNFANRYITATLDMLKSIK